MKRSRFQVVVWALVSLAITLVCSAQEGFAPLKPNPVSPPRGDPIRPAVPPSGESPLAARLSFPAVASAARDRPTITVHSATWCIPCISMQSDVGNGDDEMAIRWTHEPIPQAIVEAEGRAGRVAMLPCATWRGANGNTQYLIGRQTLAQLQSSYDQTQPVLTMSGEPPVGALNGINLAGLLDRVRASGITSARCRWRRDAPTSLVVGKPWSLLDVIGASGSLSVAVDGPTWPIKAASFDYRFNGESLTLDAGPVTLPLRSVGSSGDRVTGDPISLAFGAITLIRMLLPLLSPTISVDLPRDLDVTLTAQPDSVHIAFADGPAVSIRSLITLRRKLTGVSITRQSVVAEFDQARWWKRITILSEN